MKPTDAIRPLRVLDKVLGGGLKAGHLGIVSARHGSGKVAVLTCMAIDHALDGTKTLHVAVGKSLSAVRAFDDEVLNQIYQHYPVGDRATTQTTVERHKQIYTFPDPTTFTRQKLRSALDFLAEHAEFRPTFVEIQGWPEWKALTEDEVEALHAIARDYRCEIWLTAHTHRDDPVDASGVPESISRFSRHFEVIMSLEEHPGETRIKFAKLPGGRPIPDTPKLTFDPTTMLIRWH